MDKLDIEKLTMEKRKEIHDAIKQQVYDCFGDPTKFVIVLPEHSILATNMDPEECSYHLSAVVTSLLGTEFRVVTGDDEPESLN